MKKMVEDDWDSLTKIACFKIEMVQIVDEAYL